MMIETSRDFYKKLGKIYCPYIDTEVILSSAGFNHLLYKSNRTRRLEKEIRLRLSGLKYLEGILKNSGTLQEKEVRDNGQIFLAFIAIVEEKKYKVVISKGLNNTYYFCSIIPGWKTSRRDEKLANKKTIS